MDIDHLTQRARYGERSFALDREPDRPIRLSPVAPPAQDWRLSVKHGLDRGFAALVLLLLSPLLLVIALAVKLSSRGPVLFRQRRVGQDGRCFDMLKFRSMRVAPARGLVLLPPGTAPGGVEGVDRRTGVGRLMRRLSIDEIPQLINVARGEMSIVGPRPERPEFVQLLADEIPGYADRHSVRVGITGLAQVRGLRGKTSIERRAHADNEYIANWSLALDAKVLLLTARAMLHDTE